jgi:hypothetical protein
VSGSCGITVEEYSFLTIDVPIGGTFSAVKELEAKIGIDLTSKTVDAKL